MQVKELKLNRMEIKNFKGIERLTIELNGGNANILGGNATGKTTVYDALTWCLFGKDSRGRTDFEIKPLAPDGTVKDHGAVTTVSVLLDVDGAPMELRRCFREKWSARRGGSEVFDGHTTEYAVNGVPIQKKGFDGAVNDLVPEEVFRMLTDVTAFCEKLPWTKRRETLFDLCGIETDLILMERDSRFSPLAEAANGMALEDLKQVLTAKRKELTRARDSLPARMDEVQHSVLELSSRDYPALHSQRGALDATLGELEAERTKAENGALLASLRNDRDAAKLVLLTLQRENEAFRAKQGAGEDRAKREDTLKSVRQQAKRYRELIGEERAAVHRMEEKVKRYRQSWMDIDRETYGGDLLCPICFQPLPPEQVEAARKKFELDKEVRKQELVRDSGHVKDMIFSAMGRIRELEEALRGAAEEEKNLAESLRGEPEVIQDIPGFAEKEAELSSALNLAEERYLEAFRNTSALVSDLQRQACSVRTELKKVDAQLAGESVLLTARQRLAELTGQKQAAAVEIGKIDSLLLLWEEFSRYKAGCIEDLVNASFQTVQFRLFREQVNGGLAECCDVTVDGVPYGSLNNAARINAGIDVIRTLSRFYGVSVPLFVDNAESVVSLLDAGTQTVRLVVSDQEKELKITYVA